MKKMLCVLGLLAAIGARAQGTDEVWKPFQFVMGDWVGAGAGKPGEATGGFSLKPDLGDKILVRRNLNQYPDRDGGARVTHEDLMVIYPAQGGSPFRAEYFDNEGHVIHYKVTIGENRLEFLSDGPAAGPRFRLTYERKPDDTVGIDFAIAPPNQEFHPYLTGTVKRK